MPPLYCTFYVTYLAARECQNELGMVQVDCNYSHCLVVLQSPYSYDMENTAWAKSGIDKHSSAMPIMTIISYSSTNVTVWYRGIAVLMTSSNSCVVLPLRKRERFVNACG